MTIELGMYTDSVSNLDLGEVCELAARIGVSALEIATGGQSPAPHLRLAELLADARARARFSRALSDYGMHIEALNCSAWPMHPVVGAAHEQIIRHTIELASDLGVEKIVTMSGCPGDGTGATTINWIWYPWPSDAVRLRDAQWERAIDLWSKIAEYAKQHGVLRIAFELHPLHLAYNVPTLLKMRSAVGDIVGANVDPSHMFWQQMDPLAVIKSLGPAVYHVHLKDCEIVKERVAVAGVLDEASFKEPGQRAWRFRTIGRSHDATFWRSLVARLRDVGYSGALCIENEDPLQGPVEGVVEAASFMHGVLSFRDGVVEHNGARAAG